MHTVDVPRKICDTSPMIHHSLLQYCVIFPINEQNTHFIFLNSESRATSYPPPPPLNDIGLDLVMSLRIVMGFNKIQHKFDHMHSDNHFTLIFLEFFVISDVWRLLFWRKVLSFNSMLLFVRSLEDVIVLICQFHSL